MKPLRLLIRICSSLLGQLCVLMPEHFKSNDVEELFTCKYLLMFIEDGLMGWVEIFSPDILQFVYFRSNKSVKCLHFQ